MPSTQRIPVAVSNPYTQTLAGKLLGVQPAQVKRLIAEGRLAVSEFRVEGGPDYVDGASLHAELRRRGLPVPGDETA